jgi:hypothetical protein
VTGHLFDPAPYGGAPRSVQARTPKPLALVDNDGRWWAVRGLKGVHPHAHLLKVSAPNEHGAVWALCGVHGSPIPLDTGALVSICERCDAERVKGKPYDRTLRSQP